MSPDQWPDLSVRISRRRWRCVPDPRLCLSGLGAAFLRGLARHAEVWVVSEFLSILDNRVFYDRKPELLGCPPADLRAAEDVRDALRIWSRLREETGYVGGPLCWVRDALRESCLPSGVEETIVQRWETMAEALDARLGPDASGPLIASMRDISALASVLHGATVWCRLESVGSEGPPLLCRHLESWRVPCRRLGADDDLVVRERNLLLQFLVEAGLAGFIWGGLDLAVVHLAVPGQARLQVSQNVAIADEEVDILESEEPRPVPSAWENAKAFWYDLSPDPGHGAR
jgi:hypothetical protein